MVLIDSESASAAEIFARVVQIEKRAVVVGDRSSGKVMEARHEFFSAGNYSPFTAGMSVTVADVHLADGKSLENVGVVPDVTVRQRRKTFRRVTTPFLHGPLRNSAFR